MTSGFYGMQAIHTRAHLLQAIYEGVVFSHMTHLNRMRERFTDVHTLRHWRPGALRCLDANAGGRQRSAYRAAAGGRNRLLWCGTCRPRRHRVYRDFSEAQRDLQHPVRTLLPDMTAHQLYQQKYQRYQHLIAALQGFHARIKEHTL